MPLALDGDWTGPGRLALAEGDPKDDGPKPRFDLEVTRSGATGTWTSPDGETVPVRLRRVPKPAPFKSAIRQPRRFDDPRWPVTLTYPAGWRLDVSDSELRLRSPDPFDVLFENELSCTQGTGVPAVPEPDEPPVEFVWPFFRGRSGWLVNVSGYGECEDDRCEPAKVEQSRGASIVRGNSGYRSYGPWGYMGAADRESHLILAGDRWAMCSDRLLDRPSRLGARR